MIDESERILMDVIHLRRCSASYVLRITRWGFLYEKLPLQQQYGSISDICSEAMMSTFNFNLETFERKIVEGREEIGEYLCQLQLSSQDLTLLSRNDLCLHTLQVLRLLSFACVPMCFWIPQKGFRVPVKFLCSMGQTDSTLLQTK